jgi:hypothetical protein
VKAWLRDWWFLALFGGGSAAFIGFRVHENVNYVPPPCVTHTPDRERHSYAQCQLGAHIKAVNGVAVCVCPEAKAP